VVPKPGGDCCVPRLQHSACIVYNSHRYGNTAVWCVVAMLWYASHLLHNKDWSQPTRMLLLFAVLLSTHRTNFAYNRKLWGGIRGMAKLADRSILRCCSSQVGPQSSAYATSALQNDDRLTL
jgi:hypothetical protein